jgi:hypothetical protein
LFFLFCFSLYYILSFLLSLFEMASHHAIPFSFFFLFFGGRGGRAEVSISPWHQLDIRHSVSRMDGILL